MTEKRLILEPLPDGTYRLADDFDVQVNAYTFTIPKGFVTDGASIPRFLWRVCGHPLESPRIYAAVVHDWLYSTGRVTRAEADEIYRALLIAYGVGSFRAYVEYYALRAFGGSHYNPQTKENN